tara:strand:+ start:1565 stop:1951 length:387 start_codon:yes stop_codon:yes gene_type:complete
MAGRPTKYTDDIVDLARMYLEGGWQEQGDAVPQIAGMALAMGVERQTLYEWAKDDDKEEFSYIFTRVMALQERGLINNGLKGSFNPAITKMMLTKHGYSDKSEIDHSNSDGTLDKPTRVELVAPSKQE